MGSYLGFTIRCCCCRSDPVGNIDDQQWDPRRSTIPWSSLLLSVRSRIMTILVISIDDSTRKSAKFPVATNSFSSSKNCAGHCIALTCGPTTIDFFLGNVHERMKFLFLVNEDVCSFYCGKITKCVNWDSWIPRETWSWQDVSFFAISDSRRVDLLYNVQNKNQISHFRIVTHYCNLPIFEQKPRFQRRHQWGNLWRLSKTPKRKENHRQSQKVFSRQTVNQPDSCSFSIEWRCSEDSPILTHFYR